MNQPVTNLAERLHSMRPALNEGVDVFASVLPGTDVGALEPVATALTEARISCNVVAAAFHDHLFVPVASANEALAVLIRPQRRSGGAGSTAR